MLFKGLWRLRAARLNVVSKYFAKTTWRSLYFPSNTLDAASTWQVKALSLSLRLEAFRSRAACSTVSGGYKHTQSLWRSINRHDSAVLREARWHYKDFTHTWKWALTFCCNTSRQRVGVRFSFLWKPCCGVWVDVRFATPFPVSVAQNRPANIRGTRTNPLH